MHIVYDVFREDLLEKKIDFDKDTISVALMREGFLLTPLDRFWYEVCGNEIRGKGYVAGGNILQNVKVTKKNSKIYICGDNTIWPSATFSASYVMLYFTETKKLIGCILFPWGVNKVKDALFTVLWDSAGIIVEDNPDDPPQYLKYYLK